VGFNIRDILWDFIEGLQGSRNDGGLLGFTAGMYGNALNHFV
jgi:hypothetical protein